MIDVSVIIPFLNEAENIGRLAEGLRGLVESNPEIRFEFLLVNDGSTDGSVAKVRASSFPAETRLLSLSQNYGSHAALRAGIAEARGEQLTFLYADLQDPPALVGRMHTLAREGFDIVWATREATQTSAIEGALSRLYARLMQRFVDPRFPSRGFDVVLFTRRVQHELNTNVEGNSSIFLQILGLGFRQTSIGYRKEARAAGTSKWTLAKKLKLLIDSFVAFSYAPIRFVTLVGFAFFAVGIGWSVYISARAVVYGDLAPGWPMLTSILLLGFGITNISLGILAEYLWRTLDASRRRPVYILESVEDVGRTDRSKRSAGESTGC
ncbi:polyisoprenyl-phosphate glycosyltransferase [Myxococcaceae bacterium]|nr:polyisoprenyl-phosphate glycosyltransferase [Myxococcaceae bacterium]